MKWLFFMADHMRQTAKTTSCRAPAQARQTAYKVAHNPNPTTMATEKYRRPRQLATKRCGRIQFPPTQMATKMIFSLPILLLILLALPSNTAPISGLKMLDKNSFVDYGWHWHGNFIKKQSRLFSVEYLDEEKAIQQDERQRKGVDQLNDPEMPTEGLPPSTTVKSFFGEPSLGGTSSVWVSQ
jgi:hypothetical protein